MDWSTRLAARTRQMQPSAIREILKLTQRSEVVSFAGGLPAPQLFPVEAIAEASRRVLDDAGSAALQYSTTEGHPPLREWIGARCGVPAESVLVTSGSQQGLDLVAKVLLDPGDAVAVAAPTYMGALRAFDAYQARYLAVPCDDEGMRPEGLAAALTAGAKLVYLIPDFDNPRGTRAGLERRRALLELAARYDAIVIEDAPYAELRFEGEPLPSLLELAPERVVHLGTFSKTLVPGFRLGWIVAPTELLAVLVRAKQAADLHTATFLQRVATDLVQGGVMTTQLPRVRAYYRGQRDAMLAALERSMPEGVHWARPKGGMFVWLTLPEGNDATELLRSAVEARVAYVPGAPFFPDGSGAATLRLSYSVAERPEIDAGMARLGELFARELRPAAPATD